MQPFHPTRPRRAWLPWVKAGIVLGSVVAAAFGVLEIGQRYLGLQKLTIEQVTISGCRNERLEEAQAIAHELCLHKPLFWFDADELRRRLEDLRWVRSLMIRRDPPDRLSLVVEERKALLWLTLPSGVFLMSDDGVILDRVGQSNATPIPVVADPTSLGDEALVRLIRVATSLRDHQKDFYDRVVELRWGVQGPMAFVEGLGAPILLSRVDPVRNVPNFQAVFLSEYSKPEEREKVRYFDLRWDGEVAVGLPDVTAPPSATVK